MNELQKELSEACRNMKEGGGLRAFYHGRADAIRDSIVFVDKVKRGE